MGLVGEGAIVTSVLPDVFPVINVEDMQTDGWRLAGWRRCMGTENRTPAGGLTAEVALENITTTGTLAVIEEIIITTDAVALINIAVNTAGSILTGTSNGFRSFTDLRPRFNPPLPTLSVTAGDAIPLGTRVFQHHFLARTPFHLKPDKGVGVLGPGSMFLVACLTADVGLAATFIWRERAIEPAETEP